MPNGILRSPRCLALPFIRGRRSNDPTKSTFSYPLDAFLVKFSFVSKRARFLEKLKISTFQISFNIYVDSRINGGTRRVAFSSFMELKFVEIAKGNSSIFLISNEYF